MNTYVGEASTANLFRREGEYWTVTYGGSLCRVRDTRGMSYLAALLARPGERIGCADLCQSTEAAGASLAQASLDAAAKERARTAVTKALRAAMRRIDTYHPLLGAHLRVAIRSGYACSYIPDPSLNVRWWT